MDYERILLCANLQDGQYVTILEGDRPGLRIITRPSYRREHVRRQALGLSVAHQKVAYIASCEGNRYFLHHATYHDLGWHLRRYPGTALHSLRVSRNQGQKSAPGSRLRTSLLAK